jgi:hypothetical protein
VSDEESQDEFMNDVPLVSSPPSTSTSFAENTRKYELRDRSKVFIVLNEDVWDNTMSDNDDQDEEEFTAYDGFNGDEVETAIFMIYNYQSWLDTFIN